MLINASLHAKHKGFPRAERNFRLSELDLVEGRWDMNVGINAIVSTASNTGAFEISMLVIPTSSLMKAENTINLAKVCSKQALANRPAQAKLHLHHSNTQPSILIAVSLAVANQTVSKHCRAQKSELKLTPCTLVTLICCVAPAPGPSSLELIGCNCNF